MTAPLERPAGRPACGARPAGAHDGRGTGTPVINPAIIRAALEHSDTHAYLATATRFGVAVSTVRRWRDRRAAAAAAGQRWPTDADVELWTERQPERAVIRSQVRSYRRRRHLTGGPLHIDGTGTVRRLRALAALGWRHSDIAAELGVSTPRVGHLAIGAHPIVLRATAAAVATVYDRLSMTPGPSKRTRAIAAAKGWMPPLAWDDDAIDDPAARPRGSGGRGGKRAVFDEVAVQRAMHGDRIHLRPAERAEAVRRLTAQRLSAAEIAARLDTTKRAVIRHRTADPARRSA